MFSRFLSLFLVSVYMVSYSNCIICSIGSITSNCATSCAIYYNHGAIGYICSSSTCSSLVSQYPFSSGNTIKCCTTDNCNTKVTVGNSLDCYDNTTTALSTKCSATGSCFIISNGTSTYRGCSEFSCSDLNAAYSSSAGYTTSCCTTSLCNGPAPSSGSSKLNVAVNLLLISIVASKAFSLY